MRIMVIPTVTGVLGTVHKGLERGLEELEIGRGIMTIQTTVVSKLAIILRESWRPEKTCCHSCSSERAPPSAGGGKLPVIIIIIIIIIMITKRSIT